MEKNIRLITCQKLYLFKHIVFYNDDYNNIIARYRFELLEKSAIS